MLTRSFDLAMMTKQTIHADLVASTTNPCNLGDKLPLSPYIVAEPGYVVAVRAVEEKDVYSQVECQDGTFQTIRTGDVLVGVLGERQALKGYSGEVPATVDVGDPLHVLNLGGIVGRCTSAIPDLGPALEVEVLGAVMAARGGRMVHARIQEGAIPAKSTLPASAPLVMVSGTAMDTGKTAAAGALVEGLSSAGYRVAAAKLTGASLMRDVRTMEAKGAVRVATFTEAGVVCSTHGPVVAAAKGIIEHLNDSGPDVIVLELGDGFVGEYGVDDLLADQEIQKHTSAHVVTATDLAGVWAADSLFRNAFRAPISVVTGPVTDNDVGRHYIETKFGIPAANALQQPKALLKAVQGTLRAVQQGAPAVAREVEDSDLPGVRVNGAPLNSPALSVTQMNGTA